MPFSICCSATTVHGILVIDVIRNIVSVATGASSPTVRGPAAP